MASNQSSLSGVRSGTTKSWSTPRARPPATTAIAWPSNSAGGAAKRSKKADGGQRDDSGVGSAWIADPCALALSLSRAPLDFEGSTPALPAFTADVGFVGEVPDPLRVSPSP